MGVLKTDERHRITLPKDVISQYGKKFIAIKTKEGILLKPIPKDPVKALRKVLYPIRDKPISEIKREAYKEALKQAGE